MVENALKKVPGASDRGDGKQQASRAAMKKLEVSERASNSRGCGKFASATKGGGNKNY